MAGEESIVWAALESSPIGFCVVSRSGQFVKVNDAMCAFLNRSREELLTSVWPDGIADLAAEPEQRVQRHYVLPDGSPRWAELSVTRFVDNEAELVLVQMVDVTPYQRTQEDLSERNDYLQAVIHSELDPRLLVKPVRDEAGVVVDLVYLDANRKALELFGLSKEQIVGASMLRSYPNMRETGLFDAYVAVLETGEPYLRDDSKVPSQFRPGRVPVDLRAVRIGDTLSVSWRDLSDRYEAQAAIAASEARYRLLAENVTDVVLTGDAGGVIQWVSPAVQRELEWQPEQWVGCAIEDFAHLEDRELVASLMAQVMQGSSGQVRLRLRDRHGVFHWAELREAPFLDDSATISGVMAAITIIDERVAQEEILRHRASHDPLTGLLTREEADRRLSMILNHDGESSHKAFIAFIDMDNLKHVNDTLGHGAGDELLRVVASRIRAMLRDTDIVARLGGDELLVVMPGMQAAETAMVLMHQMVQVATAPHPYAEHTLTPRMSVGLAPVLRGDQVEDAVRRADAAMYRAKAAGGNCVVQA